MNTVEYRHRHKDYFQRSSLSISERKEEHESLNNKRRKRWLCNTSEKWKRKRQIDEKGRREVKAGSRDFLVCVITRLSGLIPFQTRAMWSRLFEVIK